MSVERSRCPNCGVEQPFPEEWEVDEEGSHPELCWGDPFVCHEFRIETFARQAAVTPKLEGRMSPQPAETPAVQWPDKNGCWTCGQPATHHVTLEWMGPAGRDYCARHAAEWAEAGWPHHVTPVDLT